MKISRALLLIMLLGGCATVSTRTESASPTGWRMSGSPLVRPVEISDDGEHIVLSFADDQELPAVFGVTQSGEETLVNGQMRAGSYIVDEIYPALIFRLGREVARASRSKP